MKVIEIDKHTPACVARQIEQVAHIKAYAAKWPDHCCECYGTGNVFGAVNDEGDFCENCIYADLCPRCHADFRYQNVDSRCGSCGWETLQTEDENNYPPVCDCQEELQERLGKEKYLP